MDFLRWLAVVLCNHKINVADLRVFVGFEIIVSDSVFERFFTELSVIHLDIIAQKSPSAKQLA
jgi:hypothetical protein